MDAESRHDLKKNELREMLSNFRFFTSDNGRYVTLALLGVVVLFVGYRIWRWNSTRAGEESWSQLMEAVVPSTPDGTDGLDSLRQIASSTGDDIIRAWAEYRLGCGLLRQANSDKTKREQYLPECIEVLRRVSGASSTPPSIAAAAEYGLANAYELQRDFEQAKTTYQAITDNEKYAGSPYQALADGRVDTVDDLNVTVMFTPGEPPAPVPPPSLSPITSQPTTTTAPAATSQTAEAITTSAPAATSQPTQATTQETAEDAADRPAASQPVDGEKTQP